MRRRTIKMALCYTSAVVGAVSGLTALVGAATAQGGVVLTAVCGLAAATLLNIFIAQIKRPIGSGGGAASGSNHHAAVSR